MSSNGIGTVIRILFIALGLVVFWIVSVAVVYIVLGTVFNLDISFSGFWYLFGFVILFRMFYPKNVFI